MSLLYDIGAAIHGTLVEGANRVATMYGESEFDPSAAIGSAMEGAAEVGRTIGSHVSGAAQYVRDRPYGEAYYHLVQTTGIEETVKSVANRVSSAVMSVVPTALSRTHTTLAAPLVIENTQNDSE